MFLKDVVTDMLQISVENQDQKKLDMYLVYFAMFNALYGNPCINLIHLSPKFNGLNTFNAAFNKFSNSIIEENLRT